MIDKQLELIIESTIMERITEKVIKEINTLCTSRKISDTCVEITTNIKTVNGLNVKVGIEKQGEKYIVSDGGAIVHDEYIMNERILSTEPMAIGVLSKIYGVKFNNCSNFIEIEIEDETKLSESVLNLAYFVQNVINWHLIQYKRHVYTP